MSCIILPIADLEDESSLSPQSYHCMSMGFASDSSPDAGSPGSHTCRYCGRFESMDDPFADVSICRPCFTGEDENGECPENTDDILSTM